MTAAKWVLNRAGVLNFWYYDEEEEFHFADGKLLLRGANASGKSVTMQSLIPVLLDGRKSPDRLDPFGSRSRRMEDYLLGEKELVERDERTGYLYLEYKKSNSNQYVTTGIGLRARRHGSLAFWGFIINDNRRIGRDFYLYKTERGADGVKEVIPLTRPELEFRIGSGGRVVRSQGEYMDLVNRHVFGFPTTESFEELIKLLIQLRSPKLSKDFKPTVIYEILNESLPPLTDEELRPLSDTIENMDQTRQQLEQLKRDQAAVHRLCRQYDEYNRYILVEKAKGFLTAHQTLTYQEQAAIALTERLIALNIRQDQLEGEISTRRIESTTLNEEKRTLARHEIFNIEEEKSDVEQALEKLDQQQRQKKSDLKQKHEAEGALNIRIQKEEEKRDLDLKELNRILERLSAPAAEAQFFAHDPAARDYLKRLDEAVHFGLWKEEAGAYKELLERVTEALHEVNRARERAREADRELGDARQALDQQRRKEKDWYKLFLEEREKLLSLVHQWLEQNHELLPEHIDLPLLFSKCNILLEEASFEEMREPLEEAYRKRRNRLEDERLQQNHLLTQKREEISDKEAELTQWWQKEDPQPPRHADTAAARRELEQKEIPHLPFFAAVEFRPDLSPQIRERIEGALREMGLLDALILPARFKTAAPLYDRVIEASPQPLGPTLIDYLYPTPVEGVAVSLKDIEAVLQSIRVAGETETAAPYLDEQGRYHLSLVRGHAPGAEQAVYIGREARRCYREREIKRILAELTALTEAQGMLEREINTLQERREQLDHEYQTFPSVKDTREAYRLFEEAGQRVHVLSRDVESKDKKLQELQAKLQEASARVRALANNLPFEAAEERCQKALNAMRAYLADLHGLELTHKDYLSAGLMLQEIKVSLNNVERDLKGLRRELTALTEQEQISRAKLNVLEHTLLQMGASEIRDRIHQVEKRLRFIPQEIEAFTKESGSIEREQSQAEKEKERIMQSLSGYRQLLEAWEDTFLAELRLELVKKKEEQEKSATPEHSLSLARKASRLYARSWDESSREKVNTGLTRVFYHEQGALAEYRPTLDDVLAAGQSGISEAPLAQEFELLKQSLERSSSRVLLLLEYDGKRINPYAVLERMRQDVGLQEQLLSEKDRELYEEIIAHNVGRVIRGRINRAEQWVKQIDRLMAERNTSGALSFSLSWRPGTAQYEAEMDTRELVELLRRDPRILKEQDFERIIQHFRSKIDRAREAMEEKGFGETFHQLIKEILDYRRWFSFTLYYRRGAQQKRELTNHAFYTFSGGEKAMAMYIPLFSAAYSRYLEAGPEAPFIISLDEAFAGVDEQNIADMFDLMEKLGFNYLINSQSLWGDYDTVSSLSICELIRPQDAPYVSVARYIWNGRQRQLISSEEELKAALA